MANRSMTRPLHIFRMGGQWCWRIKGRDWVKHMDLFYAWLERIGEARWHV